MRILFVASDVNALGGIQQYNRKFLEALRLGGNNVSLLEIKKGDFFSKIFFVLRFFLNNLMTIPEIIICAHIHYASLGFFAKKIFGRKYIICTHGVDVWDVNSFLERKSMREAALITTVAEYTRDKIISQLPEVRGRIVLLYNPVDGGRFIPKGKSPTLVKRYGLEGKKIIFTVARLSAMEGYKGYDRVIEAMPRILDSVPDAVYLLAGKGDDSPRVKKLIDDLRLKDRVIMAGYVSEEEIVDYYNLADVFIMPSKAEGAPAVFLEALACGIPVIAGNKDGSATPLLNGETGLLIDPESSSEISRAVISVLTKTAEKNLLNRDFLRSRTLEIFDLKRFPRSVDEILKMV